MFCTHLSIYESCRLLLLVNKQKARDRYRHVAIEFFFFDPWNDRYLILINIKIEEKLSRIWAYSIEILHQKFYNQSILYYSSIDNWSSINPSKWFISLILYFQWQAFIVQLYTFTVSFIGMTRITISGRTSLYFPILNKDITLNIEIGSSKVYILSSYRHCSGKWTAKTTKLLAHQPLNGDNSESFIRSFSGSCLQWVGHTAWKFVTTLFFPRSRSVDKAPRAPVEIYIYPVLTDVPREGARAVCVNAIGICRCEPPARETRKMIINLPPCLFSNV